MKANFFLRKGLCQSRKNLVSMGTRGRRVGRAAPGSHRGLPQGPSPHDLALD
jgi:hypothetical protein